MSRARRGLTGHLTGAAAEEAVARQYRAAGARILATRHRTPHGEIDLVVQDGPLLIFVEVKSRKSGPQGDNPISPRQWKRLENAAFHFMLSFQNETGVQPPCRFDVALTGADGAVRIIENARSFDEH